MRRVACLEKTVKKLVSKRTLLAFLSVLVFALPTHIANAETGGTVADSSSERSITVYKYQIKDSSELGDRGTGEAATVDAEKKPISGIKFKIQKVIANNGVSLTDPLVQKENTHYTIDPSYTAQIITTDTAGMAKLVLGTNTTVDGIYLVTEEPDDRDESPKVAKPADPFFVMVPQTKRVTDNQNSLIYAIVVQPKNILESLINPSKTIQGGSSYSIKSGQSFTWEATATVPNGLYSQSAQDQVITPLYDDNGLEIPAPNDKLSVVAGTKVYADYFTMTDTIVSDLILEDVTVEIQDNKGVWTELVLGTDYTLSVNGNDKTTGPITGTDGSANEVVMSLVKPNGNETPPVGMEKVQGAENIRVLYKTKTVVDYNGAVQNTFDVKFKSPGLKPVNPNSDNDIPKYYTGGFDIEKTAEDTKSFLENAKFHIALSKESADKNIFLALDGNEYGDGTTLAAAEAAAEAAGTALITSSTDENGKASFNGLKLDWFKDENNNGVQDDNEPNLPESDIKRSYWVVETTSPNGYELLKESKEVVVTLDTKNTVSLEVVNKKQTNLPFTGGTGRTILIVIAVGAITIGTAAIIIDKKKQKA